MVKFVFSILHLQAECPFASIYLILHHCVLRYSRCPVVSERWRYFMIESGIRSWQRLHTNLCTQVINTFTAAPIPTSTPLHPVVLQMDSFKCHLKGPDTFARFSTIFHKGDNFLNFMFAFLRINSLLKGLYSNRKEFGSNFFLLER